MTTPLSHGFPDWGRQRAASDINILTLSSVNLVASTVYGPFFVGNMPYLYLRFDSASSMNVGIAWFADAAATQSLFGDVATTATGGECVVAIPVRGPYVRFTVGRGAYPGTVSVQAYMTPTRFNVYSGTDGETNLITIDGSTINAGATSTVNATSTRAGRVHWDATLVLGVVYLVRLYAVDFVGTLHLLGVIDSNTGRGGGVLYVPALPLRVLFSNFDGANKTAYLSVVHHPFDD